MPSRVAKMSRLTFDIEKECEDLKMSLSQQKLSKMVFEDIVEYNIMGQHYNQFFKLEFAPQVIAGLLEYIKHYEVTKPTDKLAYIDLEKKRLDILLNCNQESTNKVKSFNTTGNKTEDQ